MKIDARRYDQEGVLRDGIPVRLRAVRPDDRRQLLDFFNRLGAQSRYFRFMVPKKQLTEKELAYLSEPDFDRHVALAATILREGRPYLVGIGRYVALEERRSDGSLAAEVAFEVDDAYQGRGIGTLLLEHLAVIARSRGITEFVADVMGENRKMMEVFARSGFAVQRAIRSGVYHVSFSIDQTEAFMLAHAEREREAARHRSRATRAPGE